MEEERLMANRRNRQAENKLRNWTSITDFAAPTIAWSTRIDRHFIFIYLYHIIAVRMSTFCQAVFDQAQRALKTSRP